jgi:hypothetical protein
VGLANNGGGGEGVHDHCMSIPLKNGIHGTGFNCIFSSVQRKNWFETKLKTLSSHKRT